jgi:hypothetical protein
MRKGLEPPKVIGDMGHHDGQPPAHQMTGEMPAASLVNLAPCSVIHLVCAVYLSCQVPTAQGLAQAHVPLLFRSCP